MGLASGVKILHVDYVNACSKAGSRLETGPYELGNPKFLESLAIDSCSDMRIFNAPFKWRRWIAKDKERFKDGAFTGFKFIIAASEAKKTQLKRVITAGGGEVFDIDCKTTFKPDELKSENINCCLLEAPVSLSSRNKETLKGCKIHLTNISFIFDYLMSDDVPGLIV